MNGFTVIDNKTGKYPNCEKIALKEEWAKHLMYCDIDSFAITEDGDLILFDDCGNCAFCPSDRFTVVFEKGGEYIKREDALKAIKDLPNVCGCSAIDRSDAEDAIMDCHNADVVPRSEVEKLEEHIDDLNDSKEHLCVMLEEARADVAREVFEKIEDQLKGMLDHFRQNYDVRESGAMVVALSQIAELKKKYTEGE